MPSFSSEFNGEFGEARTLEVQVRSTDFAAPAAQAENNRAVLIRMDGAHEGELVTLEQTPFTVGRHPTNSLRVDDDSMSRFHSRVVRDAGNFYVEDLGSRNGTFVQGKRVQRQKLEDDDWVQFGPRVGFRFAITDVKQEHLLKKLYQSSTRDALTGVYNRMHFEDRLRAEIAFAVRHSTEASLVLLDIDFFKKVNDTYGHQAGDAVLKHVAQACAQTVRTEDVFARFGGEEFAAVLRGISVSGSARMAERLRLALARSSAVFEGRTIPVTISAGCAAVSCCLSNPSADELIAIADRRLYAAKQGGRNRVVASG
jgi:diguanylate cyclase (GGDEF)-like protein